MTELVTKKLLFSQLERLGIKRDDALLVHSSMKAFGRFETDIDGLIDAFCEYLSDGLFIVPTHTWATVNKKNPVFDVKNAEPCVGLLPRVAVKRTDGIRSRNPTHSVMVFGKGKEDFVAGEERLDTPTPRNGCYGKLIDLGGAVLLLGVTHKSDTFIHCLEETANVPYRLSRKTVPFIDFDGTQTPHPMKTIHCPYCEDVSRLFPSLQQILIEGGAETHGTVGNAPSVVCRAKRASEMLLPIMRTDDGSDYLLPDVCKRYTRRQKFCPLNWFFK